VRIRKLVASSSALIAAAIFGVATASAASAASPHGNAVAAASAVNAGAFETSARSIPTVPAVPKTPSTPKNGQCAGAWGNVVSNVVFQRATTGGLAWGFFLTKIAQEKLGPVVAVDITAATINNRAIHTPYAEHVQSSNYNFHASLKNYEFIGSRVLHTIKTGDKLNLIWFIEGSSGEDAYRYVRCTIPKPGAH
jgi:hypothetical protein